MNATPVIWPFMLFLIIGIIFFIILLIKLLSKNPTLAVILLMVPVVLIAVFILMHFLDVGVPRRIPQISIPQFSLAFMLLAGLIVGFIILMIKLIKKNPQNAAILLIIPIVLIAVFVLLNFFSISPRRVSQIRYPQVRPNSPGAQTSIRQWGDNPGILEEDLRTYPVPSSQSPIWSDGMEQEFEADVYSSKESAARAIAWKLDEESLNLSIALDDIKSIIIYRAPPAIELAETLRDTILNLYPGINCRTGEPGELPETNEIRISLNVINRGKKYTDVFLSENCSLQATISYQRRSRVINIDYNEKPWVEDFASFANSQPRKHYVVAKSAETSMTSEEANQESIQDACSQIRALINDARSSVKINYDYLLRSGIVVDKFVQSFNASTGKIWRQAILLDASPEKLNLLAEIISGANRTVSMGLIKTILSILGLFILITIVYAFLNAATRGYYSLTLKIAGIILAVIFLFIILTIS